MKKIILLLIVCCSLCVFAQKTEPSKVYFTSDISADGVLKVFKFILDEAEGNIAFKVHFGKEGNQNFLSPILMKDLVLLLKATLG